MTVVVGADGSRGTTAAIRLAATEARYRSAPLLAVMAYSAETTLGAPATQPVATLRTADDDRLSAETMLRDAVVHALGAEASQVDCHAVPGLAGRALVESARAADAQLIVLATRSGAGMSRLLGTVSQYVLRNAPCPVLVVPEASQISPPPPP